MHWLELLNFALPVLLVVVGYLAGRVLERRHYASLRQRERELQPVLAFSTRYVPEGVVATGSRLASGSVVVSSDYFKTFVAGFRNLVGGRFRGYETLLERARREAMLRLKADALRQGSRLVIGVRFHTTRVAGSTTPSVEVMAFGTALLVAPAGPPQP
jgi:uncharacterized protein YbjQ (UPF0145 family)